MCEHHGTSGDKPVIVPLSSMNRRDIVRNLWAGTMLIGTVGVAGCESAAELFAPSDADLVPWPHKPGKKRRSRPRSPRTPRRTSGCRLSAAGSRASPICPTRSGNLSYSTAPRRTRSACPAARSASTRASSISSTMTTRLQPSLATRSGTLSCAMPPSARARRPSPTSPSRAQAPWSDRRSR